MGNTLRNVMCFLNSLSTTKAVLTDLGWTGQNVGTPSTGGRHEADSPWAKRTTINCRYAPARLVGITAAPFSPHVRRIGITT